MSEVSVDLYLFRSRVDSFRGQSRGLEQLNSSLKKQPLPDWLATALEQATVDKVPGAGQASQAGQAERPWWDRRRQQFSQMPNTGKSRWGSALRCKGF